MQFIAFHFPWLCSGAKIVCTNFNSFNSFNSFDSFVSFNSFIITIGAGTDHINSAHRKNSPARYSFSYWIVDSKDRSEKEINKKHHTIYPKDW